MPANKSEQGLFMNRNTDVRYCVIIRYTVIESFKGFRFEDGHELYLRPLNTVNMIHCFNNKIVWYKSVLTLEDRTRGPISTRYQTLEIGLQERNSLWPVVPRLTSSIEYSFASEDKVS